MCGIAGIFHLGTIKPVDPARVERMCEAIAHRGPNGAAVWTAAGVGLGLRHMALPGGEPAAPRLQADDGRAAIAFDGRIYNARDLRRELEALGATFRTRSDAETVLGAWRQWGIECLARLHGMFAFALYDGRRRTLLVARDRLGAKPLFTARLSDGSLAFASELKGLLAHPLLRRDIDPLAIEDFLAWGYVPDDRSILKSVEKLPAGHCRLLRHNASPGPAQAWWDVSFAERRGGFGRDLEAELLHRMREAVTDCMVGDGPVGALLAGEIDSASVVALMTEASPTPVRTRSVGFDLEALDETMHTTRVAELFKTEHETRVVPADPFEAIYELAAMFDEPFADPSALPTWRVCQLSRESVRVVLSGEGADEAMAGHRRLVSHARAERIRGALPAEFRDRVIAPLARWYPRADWVPRPLQARSRLQALAGDGERGYVRTMALLPPELRATLYTPELGRQLGDYRAELPLIELMRSAPARSGLDKAQYAELKFGLPGGILARLDRTGMAAGIEARAPWLDHRFVEFAAMLPERMRVRGGQGKWLLKQAMRRYLPDEMLNRPKRSFTAPIAQWFRGPLASEARALAGSAALARTGWFDLTQLGRLAEAHVAGRSDHSSLLWQMLMLDRSLVRLRLIG